MILQETPQTPFFCEAFLCEVSERLFRETPRLSSGANGTRGGCGGKRIICGPSVVLEWPHLVARPLDGT